MNSTFFLNEAITGACCKKGLVAVGGWQCVVCCGVQVVCKDAGDDGAEGDSQRAGADEQEHE